MPSEVRSNPASPGPGTSVPGDDLASILRRLRALMRRVHQSEAPDERLVHRLRIALRRAGVGLALLDAPHARARWERVLRRARRAAGRVRDVDVHTRLIRAERRQADVQFTGILDWVIRELVATRQSEAERLRERCAPDIRARLPRRTSSAATRDPGAPRVREPLARLIERARACEAKFAEEPEALHPLRIALKRARYAAELAGVSRESLAPLRDFQMRAGQVRDAESLLAALEPLAERPGAPEGLDELIERHRRWVRARRERLDAWWQERGRAALSRALLAIASPPATSEVIPAGAPESPGLFPAARLAAIDVGSNSIRLIVAELLADGRLRVMDDEKQTTRMAECVTREGSISPEAMTEAAEIITRLAGIARGYGVSRLAAVGTSALRDATNAPEFIEKVREKAGVDVEVISGEEEARLAFASASEAFHLGDQPMGILDVGGGSVQIALASGGALEQIHSLPLGAVRLEAKFRAGASPGTKKLKRLKAHVKRLIRGQVGEPPIRPRLLIGTGGTISALGSMAQAEQGDVPAGAPVRIQGMEVSRETLRRLLDRLADMPPAVRRRVRGLPPDRLDIIIPGLVVVDQVMKHLGIPRLAVHQGGVRAGLLRRLAEELTGAATRPPMRPVDGVRQLARALSYEHAHSEHVTALALSIFDQIAAHPTYANKSWAGPEARFLLEAAGVLHDIGYVISYRRHHRHSERIVLHADLPGLSPRQIAVVSLLCRYHRRSEPSKSHRGFAGLDKADRSLVRRLAAILRIADGLDRAHAQIVKGVTLTPEDETMVFRCHAEGDATTDMWGAERKAGLLAREFGVGVRIERAGKTPG